jgi:hypothetical protein
LDEKNIIWKLYNILMFCDYGVYLIWRSIFGRKMIMTRHMDGIYLCECFS